MSRTALESDCGRIKCLSAPDAESITYGKWIPAFAGMTKSAIANIQINVVGLRADRGGVLWFVGWTVGVAIRRFWRGRR